MIFEMLNFVYYSYLWQFNAMAIQSTYNWCFFPTKHLVALQIFQAQYPFLYNMRCNFLPKYYRKWKCTVITFYFIKWELFMMRRSFSRLWKAEAWGYMIEPKNPEKGLNSGAQAPQHCKKCFKWKLLWKTRIWDVILNFL